MRTNVNRILLQQCHQFMFAFIKARQKTQLVCVYLLFCSDSRAGNDHDNVCISKPAPAVPKYTVGVKQSNKQDWHGNPDTEALQYTLTFCLFIYMFLRQEMVSKSNVRERRNHDMNGVERPVDGWELVCRARKSVTWRHMININRLVSLQTPLLRHHIAMRQMISAHAWYVGKECTLTSTDGTNLQ